MSRARGRSSSERRAAPSTQPPDFRPPEPRGHGTAPRASSPAVGAAREPADSILQPGRNCWRVDRAHRFYCVQDAADYFRLIRQALLRAQHTVFSLGWDINARIDLLPGVAASDAPTRLDELLGFIARRRPHLRCYILTWDYGPLYTLERDPVTRWRLGWRLPRGIRFGFDDHHPIGASHHQKLVVVDDWLAFCGGIDLTGHRWDTSAHRLDEPARLNPLGRPYDPYHEVQAMVMGPVAASLGVLARDRWRALGAERMPPLGTSGDDLWPSDVTPDLTGVGVAIARTMPAFGTRPAIRECEALFVDSIARARQSIYIESQYFTNDTLAAELAARLREPAGPEVIVVTPEECHGWLEQTTMGAFRDGAFRQLIAADAYKRLRIVYPAASRARGVPTFVHSKVMIVDDELARIGSANFSHRSMGVDTECDLAVDAAGDPGARSGIRHIRNRLLGEHLGLPADAVAAAIEREGSLGALIDARENSDRTLVRLRMTEPAPQSGVLRAAADPDEPIAFGFDFESLLPAVEGNGGRSPHLMWILPAVVLAAAIAVGLAVSRSVEVSLLASVQHALDGVPRATPSAVWIGGAAFALASLLLVPFAWLAIAAGVLFGGVHGGLVGLIGSVAAAVIGYAAGRLIGLERLRRWISRPSYRSVRQLGAAGVSGVVALRLAGVAGTGSIQLLCGAGRVPFGQYLVGTVMASVPAVAALSGLGALLRQTLIQPSISTGLLTIGAAMLLFAVAAGLRTLLLIRQFGPSVSNHDTRAEFG